MPNAPASPSSNLSKKPRAKRPDTVMDLAAEGTTGGDAAGKAKARMGPAVAASPDPVKPWMTSAKGTLAPDFEPAI